MPSFAEERRLTAQGYRYIAGIDEAGRGALAGPVVAAAVILPRHPIGHWVEQVRDSKLLSPDKRDYLFHYIQEAAVSVAVGVISHEIIDAQNIVKATRLAMKQAIDRLSPPADTLLIDYLRLPEIPLPQKGIVNGDRLCFSIACASIMAKVTRDRLMIELNGVYPGYGLAQHKGYWTEEHLICLNRLGPARIHRTSFQPIKGMTGL
ncbi:ribonuclease HII [Chloroflexota bacterium]